jgi:hypothetical protein
MAQSPLLNAALCLSIPPPIYTGRIFKERGHHKCSRQGASASGSTIAPPLFLQISQQTVLVTCGRSRQPYHPLSVTHSPKFIFDLQDTFSRNEDITGAVAKVALASASGGAIYGGFWGVCLMRLAPPPLPRTQSPLLNAALLQAVSGRGRDAHDH